MKLGQLSGQGFFRSGVAALTMCSALACGAQQAPSHRKGFRGIWLQLPPG